MSAQQWKDAYKNMVMLAVLEALDAVGGSGCFTLNEFCDHFELRKTHNLRRRLEELCAEGTLARFTRYQDNGRLAYSYCRPVIQELPFNDVETEAEQQDWQLPF